MPRDPKMQENLRRVALQKLATEYTVASGDTLSGISKKYGLSTNDLQRINNLPDPNKIKPGQKLRLSAPVVQKPQNGLSAVSAELRKQFNNPNLEAAILANINRETGGTFNYQTWQGNKKQVFDPSKKQSGGYGLFQLTGSSLTAYKNWLAKNKAMDSLSNQVGFIRSSYGPGRSDWKKNTALNSGLTQEQLADWWHRSVETPAHVIKGNVAYSPAKIQKATQQHNTFMNRLRSGKTGWGV